MFNVYMTKDVVKDDYLEGEIGECYVTAYNVKIGSVPAYQYCLEKIQETAGIELKSIDLDTENNCFSICKLETASGDEANQDEINRWKNNKCELFNAHYSFTITEEKEVKLKEF